MGIKFTLTNEDERSQVRTSTVKTCGTWLLSNDNEWFLLYDSDGLPHRRGGKKPNSPNSLTRVV